MFNLSGSEIVVILLLALVVLGPEKLPDAMRRAGRTYRELKKISTSFQSEMRSALDEPMREMRETADLLRDAASFEESPAASRPPASPGPVSPAAAPSDAAAPEPAEPAAPAAGEPAAREPAAREPADEPTVPGNPPA